MNRFQLRPGWSGSRLVMLAVVAFLGLGPLAILFRVAGATPDRQVVANSGSVLQLLFAGGDIRHSQAVAWGDIEGDGDLDLYVGNGIYPQWISWLDYSPYNPTDQVYINNGRGRFTIRDIADEPADGSDTRGVAWGDMDGDGDLDVAVANGGEASGPQPNRVYENVAGVLGYAVGEEGRGWESAESYVSSSTGWGDWDGDGDLDLAYGNEGAPNQVYENISGTLQLDPANGIGWEAPEAYQTSSLAWGDWDGDGDLDLAFGNYDDGDSLQLYENISGTLQLDPERQMGWRSDTIAPIQAIAWGDWDGDGDLDLAAGGGDHWHVADGLLQLWENENSGAGLVWQRDATAPASLDKAVGLAWADWDRDGDLDLIAANNRGGGWGRQNQVYENDGGALRLSPQNDLGWQSDLAANLNSETTYAVAAGDADGDGDLDLAFANGGLENGGQANLIYQNTATVIGFARPAWQSADAHAGTSAAWGDWDGDGDLDLAITNEFEPVVVYENVEGALSLDPPAEVGWVAPITNTAAATDAAWGDWDGDGDLDLAVGNDGAPDLVYENDAGRLALDPAAGLGWQTPISDTSRTRAVAWGDWDGDGDLDLALGRADDVAQVYENEGGTLQLNPSAGLGWESSAALTAEDAAWGDWDDDGDLDLALGARVFVNHEGRLLFDPVNGVGWDSGFPATTVAWGDSDGDGDLDLAAGSVTRARVYENLGGRLEFNPVSGTGWQSFEIFQVRSVAWGDGDGDGDLDLAIASDANWDFEPNRVFENVDGDLSALAAWATTDERQTGGILQQSQDVAWGDVDGDGDLDLAFANACTGNSCDALERSTQVYLNTLQNAAGGLPARAVPLLSVSDPDITASANFYASPQIVSSDTIAIPYRLVDPAGASIGRVEMFYSLDGGDNWRRGQPTADTTTTNLATSAAGTEHVFGWDTFGSDFFGRSDNVTIRLVVYQTPPTRDVAATGAYLYFNSVAGSFQRPATAAATFPFRVQSTQVRVVDASGSPVEGAWVYRLPAGQTDGALLMPDAARPQMTNAEGVLAGGGEIQPGDRLVALAPAPENPVDFSGKVRLFYTSGAPTESGLDMVAFDQPGVVELVISEANPLLLFDLDVSLEWDARNDATFQTELTNSFQRASEILYDVTNGQAALGVVQVFQDKEYWPQADVVVLANNSLRPSAAIGGVAKLPITETVRTDLSATKVISNAYYGGQIRMGTVWDPYGENTAELGEEWWRALAHELSHYLLFLPDNYLGFKDSGVLGRINCQGSFMTSTYDPAYSEFLTAAEWRDACLDSLAQRTTGRTDWQTIRTFYGMLAEPAALFEGPVVQSLDLTDVILYTPEETRAALRARNFDVRDAANERLRLPAAQAYLFQTQGTADPTDDMILQLGTPTGGGDRLKVRGAFPGDRLCLIESDMGSGYIGCDADLQVGDVSIHMEGMDPAWQPQIEVTSVTSRTVQITVTQPLSPGEVLQAQIFPLHYGAAPGLAGRSPTAALQTVGVAHTATLTMSLPAYEVAVRVWAAGDTVREAVSQFYLNPPWPTGGPNTPAIGGPNTPAIGGPNTPAIGGPNTPAIGGPNTPAIGGPNTPAIGGPNTPAIGGPNTPAIGGPNTPAIGGANRSFNAPILSADAQVVVYSTLGYFESNGVVTLQQLGRVPALEAQPWLVPVGQAYAVALNPAVTSPRVIGFNYLQREVPAGYEHTLAIYFLPEGSDGWQRLETIRYVENLVVAELQEVNGTYAVMSTLVMPELVSGWNLFMYPLPDARGITETLAALGDRIAVVYESEQAGALPPDTAETNVALFEFAHAYWLWLEGDEPATLYLAPPRPSPDGVVPGS